MSDNFAFYYSLSLSSFSEFARVPFQPVNESRFFPEEGKNFDDTEKFLAQPKETSLEVDGDGIFNAVMLRMTSETPSQVTSNSKKIIKKSPNKIKTKSNLKKNIHRYLTRKMIRCLASEDFKERVMNLCLTHGVIYEEIKQYYLGQIENFTNIHFLSEHWSQDHVFREFSKWFLKERAIRYILNGKMENPSKYIHYKNHVMLYYVDRAEEYKSNKK
jgi:hypothetical protein